MQEDYDILIIGAGAVGCAVARELSRYTLRVAVLEKNADVAGETSGRNSAVVHAGFNNKPGSLMAKLCVKGNQGFERVCRTLDVPYKKTGKLLVAFDEADMAALESIICTGERNGCKGLRIVSREEAIALAPNVGGIGGMLSPETAIVFPAGTSSTVRGCMQTTSRRWPGSAATNCIPAGVNTTSWIRSRTSICPSLSIRCQSPGSEAWACI